MLHFLYDVFNLIDSTLQRQAERKMMATSPHFVPLGRRQRVSFLLYCLVHFITLNRLSCSFLFLCFILTLFPLSLPCKSFYLSSFNSLHSHLSEDVGPGTPSTIFFPLFFSFTLTIIHSLNLSVLFSAFPQLPLSMLYRIQPFSNPSHHRAPPLISPSSLSRPLISNQTSSFKLPPLSDPCLSFPSFPCPSLLLHGHPSTFLPLLPHIHLYISSPA